MASVLHCLGATEALSQSGIAAKIFNLGRIRAQVAVETIFERRVFHRQSVRRSAIFDPALESLEDGRRLAAETARAVTQAW